MITLLSVKHGSREITHISVKDVVQSWTKVISLEMRNFNWKKFFDFNESSLGYIFLNSLKVKTLILNQVGLWKSIPNFISNWV